MDAHRDTLNVIAIDGPAGSGKSSTARAVAEALGFLYLDTGAMYRAVGLAFLEQGWAVEEGVARAALDKVRLDLKREGVGLRVFLDGRDVSDAIRTPEASAMASRVSTLKPVREKLVAEQRRIARSFIADGGGVVLDGRDIGTIVFPEALLKIFMVADPRVRALRRVRDLRATGREAEVETVLDELKARDAQDAGRALAPLRQAEDAVLIDTSELGFEEQVARVLEKFRERQNETVV